MNNGVLARRGALGCAILISGCLLVTACSGASGDSASSTPSDHGDVAAPAIRPANQGEASGSGSKTATQTAALAPAHQNIIYTASITIRAPDVTALARQVTGIVVAAGGYTAGENESGKSSSKGGVTIDLTLKVPVTSYEAVLGQLSSPDLGKQVGMSQRATDVTQRVANVNSLVTSELDAIAALDGLLKRAGTVPDLLQVQQQISADESQLNSLQAQQRALDQETAYGTVTMTLVGPRMVVPVHRPRKHTFVTGLAAGWHALGRAAAAVATAFGTALPFLVVGLILTGAGWLIRRRLLRRRAGADPTVLS